ncbi:MAG: iron-sulfur cluster assembly scaffold protein [Rubellimicrobium sp.]|nr:iron-sulfur cluster assembly scaffold protein [Rubellimicrobium sp.]
MTTDSDLVKLYSTRILALAADMPRTTRLAAPDATARARAPLCGSTVTVDITVEDGVVRDFGQEVRACALGQAAASIVGAAVVGLGEAEIRKGRDQLVAMLRDSGPPPTHPFEALEVLAPARDYRNRHASILLPFEATLDAFKQLRAAQEA